MKVKVKKIFNEDTVWTTVVLKSGSEIEFFDENCRDLSEYIDKELDLLIKISFFSIISCKKEKIPLGVSGQGKEYKINGTYLKDYLIPSSYFSTEHNIQNGIRGFHGIQTDDGVFLIRPIMRNKGEKVCLDVSRFDLFGGKYKNNKEIFF